ncbi:heme exporter protein CcmB [Wolbachia endosymbiont of Onchocerca gibsoni]|uniref:heme exporter protein CcmB n=1 Tax=Wolbachia endosymbiont of Onchocerca gibsoni TaxID=118986 RepID=UPI0023D81CF8|nr:heme exporter protein CcmB [Wolbachia endosymbiont of Onchocerca gibsoni]MDF0607747.1 heme exporter protein CcmB [Wolbachia endosymbiont of Onchocerca gibsoni]
MISLIKKLVISNSDFTYIICIFIVMLSLSSFTLGNNSEREVMLALIWICATFVLQISTSDLFSSDYRDGILEQIFIQPLSSKFIIAYKILAHWILFGLPISAISSIFSFVVLGSDIKYSIIAGLSLLLNMLIVTNISATGSALMIGRNNLASGIPQILVLPIIMPTFVYFKLLIQFESLSLNTHILLITVLVFAILLINSTIATHIVLKFAVEQD